VVRSLWLGTSLKTQPQGELYLARGIRIVRPRQARRHLVIRWEVDESQLLCGLQELHNVGLEAVIRNIDALIIAIQEIERFRHKIQLCALVRV
jgi:hypothetical protein